MLNLLGLSKMLLLMVYFLILCIPLWFFIKKLFSNRPCSLTDQVIVITGASSGLGRECAFAFCKQKCRLVLCARRVEELNKLKNELEETAQNYGFSLQVKVVPFDITNIDDINQAVKNIDKLFNGQIDILINNAGVSYRGTFKSTEIKVFEEIMKINFFGQVALTKAVLPTMLLNRCGHIVAVGSIQVSFFLKKSLHFIISMYQINLCYVQRLEVLIILCYTNKLLFYFLYSMIFFLIISIYD